MGFDFCLSFMNVLYECFNNPKYTPVILLVELVKAGKLGAKSGEGFYVHTAGNKELVVSQKFAGQ